MAFRDNLILVTSPEDFADEHVLIERLFELGVSKLHVRKPGRTKQDLDCWLLGLDFSFRKRCILHSDLDTALELEVGGVHSNSLLLTDSYLAKLPDTFSLSTSCFSFDELMKIPSFVDYVFLGPVYDSFPILRNKPSFSIDELKNFFSIYKSKIGIPIYAFGGIDKENLSEVEQVGFSGAGLLSGIWNYADPLNAWSSILQSK